MARIGAVERLVAEREVGDDVALDCSLEQRPLEPRWIAQVAPLDARIGANTDPSQNVPAKAFNQSKALGSLSGRADGNTCLAACRHLGENKFYESKALFDLTNANPDSRVNVALREHGNVVIVKKGIIRRVGR